MISNKLVGYKPHHVINLTPGFEPAGPEDIRVLTDKFPGGEPHVKLSLYVSYVFDVLITSRTRTMDEFMQLIVAIDAARRHPNVGHISVLVSYMPGARQDRVANQGEPLTVSVFANILNNITELERVIIVDPHSDVTSALINNVVVLDNMPLVEYAAQDSNYVTLVAPDAGAVKKVNKLLGEMDPQYLSSDEMITGGKHRDTTTGRLSGFHIDATKLDSSDAYLIVDDICDGGGTFIGLAEAMKRAGAEDIRLVVTHGIFSKGFKELSKYFTKIYTYDIWSSNYAWDAPEDERGSEIVDIYKLNLRDYD